jgi:hypothetical protein
VALPATDSYAAGNNLGSLNPSPRTIMAQAMRAILLAAASSRLQHYESVPYQQCLLAYKELQVLR